MSKEYRNPDVERRLESIKQAWRRRTGDSAGIEHLLCLYVHPSLLPSQIRCSLCRSEEKIMDFLSAHKQRIKVSPPLFKQEHLETSTRFLNDQMELNHHHSEQQNLRLWNLQKWGSSKQQGPLPQLANEAMFVALTKELWYGAATIFRDEQGNIVKLKF